MQRTKIVDALKSTAFGSEVNVKGWVRTRRGNKNVSFIAINDGYKYIDEADYNYSCYLIILYGLKWYLIKP